MDSAVREKYMAELVKLLQDPSLYSGQYSICLPLPCLNYLQSKFVALQEGSRLVALPANLKSLQDNLAKILSLKLIPDPCFPIPPTLTLSLEPFRALQILVFEQVPLQLVTGLVRLRDQLRTLVIMRCQVENIEEVIVCCGGDDATVSFAWNNLRELNLSHNNIKKLGISLQYLPLIEKVNFSNNNIGHRISRPPLGSSSNGSSSSSANNSNNTGGGSTAAGGGGSDQSSTVRRRKGDKFTEGIACIDSVSVLHLGFNKLSSIPRFGDRAKYNLKVLILRNNRLDTIEGLEVLEGLEELDLTDNLLSKHSSLKACKNLPKLTMLILTGNPLSLDSKHRLKTAKYLSEYLVDKDDFRLDGKNLSTAEKKCIVHVLRQYPTPDPGTPFFGGDESELLGSVPETSKYGSLGKRGGRKKDKCKTATIIDSDEEDDVKSTKSAADIREDFVPLLNKDAMLKTEELRKQLDDDWLKSANASSRTTTERGSQPGSRVSVNLTSHISSRKSSLSSLNSIESSHGSRGDVDASGRGYSSGERQQLKQSGHNSNEQTTKRYSPNEMLRKKTSSPQFATSPKSSENQSTFAKIPKPGDVFKKESPTMTRRAKQDGGLENEFEKRLSSGSGSGSGHGDGSSSSGRGISLEGSSKRSSKSLNRSGSLEISFESTTTTMTSQRISSALTICKDDDPSYIHSSFNIHLDLNVFENERGEMFKMIFRSPVVKYGKPNEQPSLLVVSNLKAYIFVITAPENPHPDTWLKLLTSHSLCDLVFINIGVGYQLLRLEFVNPNTCYSFLIQDEEKCTNCSTKLTYIVSHLPNSSFKRVGVCPFSMDMIRHPDRALREAKLAHYDKISGRITPAHKRPLSATSNKSTNSDDDELIMYQLAYRYVTAQGKGRRCVPVTVVLADSMIYLAKENFSQWPLPKNHELLPEKSSLNPPYEDVEQKELYDIEQIVLDIDQTSHVILCFFKEASLDEENENSQWNLVMYNSACVTKLVQSIKKPWENLLCANRDIGADNLLDLHHSPNIRSHSSTPPKNADVSSHEQQLADIHVCTTITLGLYRF